MKMTKWEQEYRADISKMTFPELWEHFIKDASQPDDWDGAFTWRGDKRYEICLAALDAFFIEAGLLPKGAQALAVMHDRQCCHPDGLSIDLCPCALAVKWRKAIGKK